MSFEMKEFETLKASLLNYIYYSDNSLTDYNVGSVLRSMLESIASEEEEVYYRLWKGLQDAIRDSILQAFSFTPAPGAVASGMVTFGRDTAATSAVVIPAGTVVSLASTGVKYVTSAESTLNIGDTFVSTAVVAQSSGASGNINSINVSLQIVTPVYGIHWAKTGTAFLGGEDTETYESVMSKFADYVNSLSRTTNHAVRYAATTATITDSQGLVTEQVLRSSESEAAGTFDIYIDNGYGNTSDALVTKAQDIIDGYIDSNGSVVEGYKAAGVIATVHKATGQTIHVTVQLETANFDTASAYVQTAINNYIRSLGVGDDVILDKLIALIFTAHPDITNINLTVPSANVVVASTNVAVVGSVTITQM